MEDHQIQVMMIMGMMIMAIITALREMGITTEVTQEEETTGIIMVREIHATRETLIDHLNPHREIPQSIQGVQGRRDHLIRQVVQVRGKTRIKEDHHRHRPDGTA